MFIYCKKCGGDLLLPDTYRNVKDVGVRCKCKSLNIIAMENGELRSQKIETDYT